MKGIKTCIMTVMVGAALLLAPNAQAADQICELSTSTPTATAVACTTNAGTDTIILKGIEIEGNVVTNAVTNFVACFSTAGVAGVSTTSEGVLTSGVVTSARIAKASSDTGKVDIPASAGSGGRNVTAISANTVANTLVCIKNGILNARVLFIKN